MIGQIAGLAADLTVTVTAGDRSEARLRSVPIASDAAATTEPQRKTAIDLVTTPSAGLAFTSSDSEVALGYAVGVSKIDVQAGRPLLIMHTGRAALSWWTQALRLTLSEDASYGRTTYLGLAPGPQLGPMPAPAPMLTLVPIAEELKIGSLRTMLAATWAIDAQWTSSASAYYEIAGGIDDNSQLFVPRRRGPGGDVGATYALSATDDLATRVVASQTTVPITGGAFLTVAATETWNHRFSDQTRSGLGGGLTYLRSRASSAFTYGYSILPNALATISHTIPLEGQATFALTGSSALGTGYNAALGVVQYFASATAGATWSDSPFTVTATASAGQSIRVRDEDPPSTRAVTATLGATYTPVELLAFEIGARSSWQLFQNPDLPSYPPQWVLFAAITVRAPPLRF